MDAKWENLVVPLTQSQILNAVADPEWQLFRETLHGLSLESRHDKLVQWLEDHEHTMRARVQVANYINALKRGGMLK